MAAIDQKPAAWHPRGNEASLQGNVALAIDALGKAQSSEGRSQDQLLTEMSIILALLRCLST